MFTLLENDDFPQLQPCCDILILDMQTKVLAISMCSICEKDIFLL